MESVNSRVEGKYNIFFLLLREKKKEARPRDSLRIHLRKRNNAEHHTSSRDVRQLGWGNMFFVRFPPIYTRAVLARSPIHLSLYPRDVVVHHRKSMDHLRISCVWGGRMINTDGKGFLQDFFTKKIFK